MFFFFFVKPIIFLKYGRICHKPSFNILSTLEPLLLIINQLLEIKSTNF